MKQIEIQKGFTDYLTREYGEGMVVSKGISNYDLRLDICKEMGLNIGDAEGKILGSPNTITPNTFRENFVNMHKALSTTLATFTGGTLPVLIPVYVDPEIVDITRRATPLVELIPRVTNYGRTADFNVITTIQTAQALPEDAALSEQNDTYYRTSLPIKYLYSVGRVTGPMFAASKQYLSSGGYVDALSLEVKNKTLALKRLEEAMILIGNGSTDWTEPVNSTTVSGTNSFNGLYHLIANTNSTYDTGWYTAASHYTDNAGAAIRDRKSVV